MITHYDLFAGIGGFSLALEEVFTGEEIKHIFCEWESFPTAVLKRHWPGGEYWGDIADLVAHTNNQRLQEPRPAGQQTDEAQVGARPDNRPQRPHSLDTDTEHEGLERCQPEYEAKGRYEQLGGIRRNKKSSGFTIVTGGFPCQPFSAAGRRKGTADDRYQWPNMFAVIRSVKPEWVIAENVRGFVTWNDGMVLETVCADLESEGYEVQPFIIPAVAVGAPHRRDRVWIIGHRNADGLGLSGTPEVHTTEAGESALNRTPRRYSAIADAGSVRREQRRIAAGAQSPQIGREWQRKDERLEIPDWNRTWQEVAFATCDDAMDDGLPRLVDGVPYSYARWRRDSLKAYGNGIVPEVAMNIMQAIKEARTAFADGDIDKRTGRL